jgi:hypothetical protein
VEQFFSQARARELRDKMQRLWASTKVDTQTTNLPGNFPGQTSYALVALPQRFLCAGKADRFGDCLANILGSFLCRETDTKIGIIASWEELSIHIFLANILGSFSSPLRVAN